MHCMAYGYCRQTSAENNIITLAHYPSHVLPGTVTIHKGTIIRGANSIAGMAGFLPYGVNREELLRVLETETCMPFISQSICSIIALLNPDTIVLSGDLITKETLDPLTEVCNRSIPSEYMPQFVISASLEEYLYEGLYQLAVDRKEI